ncbi:TetR/AcrR family transcriptional regulator [Streptomyces xiaopingdaonensis]|uniref:TetR/AcrR family transcriptional regulator n=1 Tax=Streptomyces xiaopingdaonensis TaxID=1565415 RepID=UPI0002DDD1FA|nr:TetR/AcrR family transcriptional regulator [Streptomyces xiaopingdaonensis]
MRRDAQRNRESLESSAREVFAEQGLHAPLDEIARRAGLGNATLYRHFPDRAALVEAVFHDTFTHTLEIGVHARAAADPWRGLVSYLERLFAGLTEDRGANELLTTEFTGAHALRELHTHNRETLALLLDRAQRQGAARTDATVEDLLFALAALGRAVPALAKVQPQAWRRQLRLLLDGLRASDASPLPGPELSGQALDDALHALGPRPHRPRKP